MFLRAKIGASSKLKEIAEDLKIFFEPVFLSEGEDHERIKRLSKQIIACVERARSDRRKNKRRQKDEIFEKDFEEIFGLAKVPV